MRESTWDEGRISEFVGSAGIVGKLWPMGPHRIILYATAAEHTRHGPNIAATCGKLWDWLGVIRPFTLVLWWRNDPRKIAADEWPSRLTVNGGWTMQNSSVIFVYRSEEWDRVFLHEMIHALGWDWEMPAKPFACWEFPTGSQLTPALFEAWTELYAEWLWCVWNFSDYGAWKRQRAWQERQALEILARAQQRGGPWRENTSVWAYYVLKAALAPHISHFLLHGRGSDADLCRLSVPALTELAKKALRVRPRAISLRMTIQS